MSSERYNLSITALLIGVPVLVGASCYYLYFSGAKKTKSNDKEAKKLVSPLDQVMQLKQTGNQNFARKNYEVAIDQYTKAIELSKEIPINQDDLSIFHQNRAACNEALANYDLVVEDCGRAIELRKNYTKAYLRRARAHEQLGDYDRAMVDSFSVNLLEKFQNQNSMILNESIVKTSSQAKAKAAMERHEPSWPSNSTIRSYFSAFTQDPIKERLTSEIKSSEQLQPLFDDANKKENENDPFSLLVRGSCLSLRGSLEEARKVFDKLLALTDSECSAKYKANALVKKSALVISDPTNPATMVEKDFEIVFELLDKALELDPENPDIYLHKAQSLTLSEKLSEALETLSRAIELKNDFYPAIAQKFYIEFKLATRDSYPTNKSKELLDAFKLELAKHPEAHDLQQIYIQVLTESGRFEDADQLLLNLIKSDPSDGSVYISRALLQFHLKSDTDEVASLLRQALEVDPKLIFGYEILGSIETQRGKTKEALEIFTQALAYCNSLSDYERCYTLLDSAKSQMAAAELLGMPM